MISPPTSTKWEVDQFIQLHFGMRTYRKDSQYKLEFGRIMDAGELHVLGDQKRLWYDPA